MANVLITGATGVDTLGEKLIPMFGTQLNITDDFWYCSELEQGIGSEPGYCKIIVPCRQGVRDTAAYDVALNPTGPASQIRQGTPVKVLRRFKNTEGEVLTPNIQGYKVVSVYHNAERDCLEVLAKDCRHDLTDICVIGRYIWSASDSNVKYQQGWFPHFNPGGRPNCIFTPDGTPVFAPYPDFGLSTDQSPADPSERSIGRACYWTLQLILMYLRAFYAYETPTDSLVAAARLAAVAMPKSPVKIFPETIEWPVGFGSELDLVSQTNFDGGVGQNYSVLGGGRKGRDLNLNGRAFVGQNEPGVFDMIFEAAGGWSYKIETSFYDTAIFRNTLVATPSRYRSESEAVDLPFAFRGQAKDVFKYPTIMSTNFGENSEMTRTKFIGLGSHVMIERRCSSVAADGTRTAQNYSGTGTPALLPAWSLADQDLMCTEFVTNTTAGFGNAEAFAKAAAKYWWVLTTWILNPAYNFMAGTIYENYSRAKITRQVLPTLLSFSGNSTLANDCQAYPIRPELYDSSKASPTWVLPLEGDGLEVFDNGIIYLRGLRDMAISTGGVENIPGSERGSWRCTAPWAVSGGKLDIQINDIRMTLVIPCDHRLTRTLNLLPGADDTGRSGVEDPQGVDSEKFENGFSRNLTIDLNGLYVSWLRIDSYPVPEAGGGTVAEDFVNDASPDTALRSDALQLEAHLQKAAAEHGRILCEGDWVVEGRFVEGWKVGTQVKDLKPVGTPGDRAPFTVRRVIARKRYTSERTTDANGVQTFKNTTRLMPQ